MLIPIVPPGDAGLPVVNLTYSTNTANVDLFAAAGSPGVPTRVNVTVNAGVYLYGTSAGVYGCDCNGFASGSVINFSLNGAIVGYGGAGGAGGNNAAGSAGGAGGPALRLGATTTIDGTGFIGGGSGGGGGGGAAYGSSEVTIGEAEPVCTQSPWTDGGAGGNGQRYNASAQGGSAGQSNSDSNGGTGGTGGTWAVAGSAGASGNVKGSCGIAAQRSGGAGGAAGKAIEVNSQSLTNNVTTYGTVS